MIDYLYTLYLHHPLVVTDSRKIVEGCLFFALRGDRFDGNAFAAQALKEGAAYTVIDDPAYRSGEKTILVDNVLIALQQLATHRRRQLDIPFIAITGSNGKTTTKELTASVLSLHYKTYATQGNLNNHIGVPLTLLSIQADAEIAVIEMGANHQGEIDFLCRIAEPTHGLITNIGKAHLEGFGGIEGVKKGKSELYRYLANRKGVVFINKDEPFLSELATEAGAARQSGYRRSDQPARSTPDTEVRLIAERPFLRVGFLDGEGAPREASTRLMGVYNFANAMTAIAVGGYFKVSAEKMISALERYLPSDNRSQLVSYGEATVILDAYNANPNSMRAALLNFANTGYYPKIVILGDMFELGAESAAEHRAVYELARSLQFDRLILVGKEFGKISPEELHFNATAEAKSWFQRQSFSKAGILIKGSRGMQLEILLLKSGPAHD